MSLTQREIYEKHKKLEAMIAFLVSAQQEAASRAQAQAHMLSGLLSSEQLSQAFLSQTCPEKDSSDDIAASLDRLSTFRKVEVEQQCLIRGMVAQASAEMNVWKLVRAICLLLAHAYCI